MTEDLTTDLSTLSDVRVISPNAALAYGNKPVGTGRIGYELGAHYVFEGSVRRHGSQLRVNARLIDTDTQLWAERFDRNADSLSTLQNDITIRIANTMGLALIAAEAARPIEHPDALGYILRERAARLGPNSRGSYAEAIRLFNDALALNPRSVEARTRLAQALVGRVVDRMTDSVAADLAAAEELIGRVLADIATLYTSALRQRPGAAGREPVPGGHFRVRDRA